MQSKNIKALGGLALALIGAIIGAMLTTDYKELRKNGESYVPALTGGLAALRSWLADIVTSPWLYLPVGGIVIVLITAMVTVKITKPKKRSDPYIALGHRMSQYYDAASHDKKYRRYTSLYHDTMKICHEMEAFMVEVEQMGIPVPRPQSNTAEDWIDLCGDYFSAVGPYLRSGNFAHAIYVGESFAERYPQR